MNNKETSIVHLALGELSWVFVLILLGIVYINYKNLKKSNEDFNCLQKELTSFLFIKEDIKNHLLKAIDTNYAKVNVATGDVELKEKIFFDIGSSDIKESGKIALSDVWNKYITILLDTTITKGQLHRIKLIGHASREKVECKWYLNDLCLTHRRAYSVCKFIIRGIGTDFNVFQKLRPFLEISGRSNADAIGVKDNIPLSCTTSESRAVWLKENALCDRKITIRYELKTAEMLNNVSKKLNSLIAERKRLNLF